MRVCVVFFFWELEVTASVGSLSRSSISLVRLDSAVRVCVTPTQT